MKTITHRTSCRICGNTNLEKVVSLGDQYLQGLFVKPGYPKPPERTVPLDLLWCDTTCNEDACGLLQLSTTISPQILYSSYWYRSNTNTTMKHHLKSIVDDIMAEYITNHNGMSVLDIGCNDGTLLSYYPNDIIKVGVDPSNAVDDITDKSITVYKDVFPSTKIPYGSKFDIITSIAMLYDLEDPASFVYEINTHLKEQGIWVFEMSYLPLMLEMNAFDTICNEHIEYYSLSVIDTLLTRYGGMKLIDVSLNDTNGGSIKCTAVKDSCHRYDVNQKALDELFLKEFEMKLDTRHPYEDFRNNINKIKNELRQLLHTIKSRNQTIHLYGASTKGNTLIQTLYGGYMSHMPFEYAADRNPDKWGAKTLGTNIEIISEEESRAMKPDYYFVLPWHFKKEILEREKDMISNGTKMIFPLPNIEIYREG